MNTTNFYTPKTLTLSMIDLLAFYELGFKVNNHEHQDPTYTLYKKPQSKIAKFFFKLGFVNPIRTEGSREEIHIFIQRYIKAKYPDANEINHGIYQINM